MMPPQPPVACNHTVFTKEQRDAYRDIWRKLETCLLAAGPIEAGCRYDFPGDADTLRLVHEWVSLERRCCPFITFTVVAGHEQQPVQLLLTGDETAWNFLQHELTAQIRRLAEPSE